MNNFKLADDIKTVCVKAQTFPDGITAAHAQLHEILNDKRHYFGISKPDQSGKISYWAAAEQLAEDEAQRLGLETFTIRKGDYNGFFIKDFRREPERIRQAFDILLRQQEVDPNGYCLEWYIGEHDVKCMVPVDDHLHFTGIADKM